MQNDLISRSALLEALAEVEADQGGIGMDFVTFEDLIKEQPTAYDVDKVVDGIHKYFCEVIEKRPEDNVPFEILDYSKAVCNIIRNGGKAGAGNAE